MICEDCNCIMKEENYRFIITAIPPNNAKYAKPWNKPFCLICIGKLNNIYGNKYEEDPKEEQI